MSGNKKCLLGLVRDELMIDQLENGIKRSGSNSISNRTKIRVIGTCNDPVNNTQDPVFLNMRTLRTVH